MSAQTDIIAKATAAKALQDEIIALAQSIAGGTPSGPTPINCVGGTRPSAITIPAGDGTPSGTQPGPSPAGSIAILGDSILKLVTATDIHANAVNYALGGQSLRRIINSINLNLSSQFNWLQTAGACVLMGGVNDLGNTTYYGPWTNGQAAGTVALSLYQGKLAPYITGKWVIYHLLPIDEPAAQALFGVDCSGYNAQIAYINSYLHKGAGGAFANCAAQIEFVPVDPSWVDAQGNLKDEYHTDGQHPSPLFASILGAAGHAKLTALGV